jgi:CheY-like chemotaxis protein
MSNQRGNKHAAPIWISANIGDEIPDIHLLFESYQIYRIKQYESLTHLPVRGVFLAHEMDWDLLEQARIFDSQLIIVFYRDQRPEVPERNNWLWIEANKVDFELLQQIVLRWAEEAWIHRNNPDLYELMGHDIRAPLAELHVMLLSNGLQNEKAIKDRVEQLRAVIDDIYWLSNSNDEVANWNIHQTDLLEILAPFIQRLEQFVADKPIELFSSEIDSHGIVSGDEKMVGRIFKLLGDLIEDRVSYGLIEVKGTKTAQEEIITIHDMDQSWLQADEEAEQGNGNTLFSVTKKLTYIKKLASVMGIQVDFKEKEEENILSLIFQRAERIMAIDEGKMLQMGVLVIDDNPLDVSWMAHILEQYVGKVFTAQDGWEAFNLLDEVKVDLILVDLQMPVMDGFTFIESLAEKYPDMIHKVVAVTAYANKEEHKKLMRYNIAGLLYKPVKQQTLVQLLNQHSLDEQLSVHFENMNSGFESVVEINEELIEHIRKKGSNLMAELRWVISYDFENRSVSEIEFTRLKELIVALEYYEQDSVSVALSKIKLPNNTLTSSWNEVTYKQIAVFQQSCWKLYKQITKI